VTAKARLEALLLDIDGTLVDSNDLHAHAWLDAFEHFGKKFSFEQMHSQIGKGGDLLVPDLLNAREIRTFGEKLKKWRKKRFQEHYMSQVEPFPFAIDTLKALHARDIKLVFASSADPDEVEHYTKILQAEELVVAKTSKGDAEHSKPSPEIFEAALEQVKKHETRTAVVGDTPYDILAAHRSALPVIAVRSGKFPEETLQKAEFIFDAADEIVRRIEEIDDYFRH
jgi:HAD superfamily hydrolase (TIGR01549 family)